MLYITYCFKAQCSILLSGSGHAWVMISFSGISALYSYIQGAKVCQQDLKQITIVHYIKLLVVVIPLASITDENLRKL